MFTRKRKLEGSSVFATSSRLGEGAIGASPVRIDYYVAGLRRPDGVVSASTQASREDSWKAVAALALFVAAIALMVAIVAVILAVRG
ncbi:hypothetical protein [Sphingosinicella sp. BN140058]|uniref:hypothetical protein n=1 Tax=Sphingosinicella sp. BN140058 TaxID=1892855 RepID=UPI001012C19C|nr:hypothetical protein [Sphingosinicella sp. BN140058]QAY79211.1 hypothetical protein ETR14_23720 [Sphingosinicella sp. BN140058]